ncbi:hypothetical protein [Aquabacterium sp.]|uniref:hypothetical protein n=1 Tax=Aquabacterium sp. TaxID=1872578 RepID=UPI002BD8E220|nr:hypothetical protein [Aquabacterium sp.]HSW04631.1 hypothetical protein [Aquabacterium sp.]
MSTMSKTALTPTDESIDQAADSAASKATGVIQSTKRVANVALDSLQTSVDDLRQAVPSAFSHAAAQVEDLTRRGIERARATSTQVREKVSETGERTVSYIKDEPIKSVLIAAAAGAAMAALIGWLARSRTRD